jgi:hypothetical protein
MNDKEGQHLSSVLMYILAWILRGGEDKKGQQEQQFPGWGSHDGLCECEMCFIGLHFLHITINIIKGNVGLCIYMNLINEQVTFCLF